MNSDTVPAFHTSACVESAHGDNFPWPRGLRLHGPKGANGLTFPSLVQLPREDRVIFIIAWTNMMISLGPQCPSQMRRKSFDGDRGWFKTVPVGQIVCSS